MDREKKIFDSPPHPHEFCGLRIHAQDITGHPSIQSLKQRRPWNRIVENQMYLFDTMAPRSEVEDEEQAACQSMTEELPIFDEEKIMTRLEWKAYCSW